MKINFPLFEKKSVIPLDVIDKIRKEILAFEDDAIMKILDSIGGAYYYICY